jgi:6-phosphogluconolactonase
VVPAAAVLAVTADLLCAAMEDLARPRLAVSGGSAAGALGLVRARMGPRWKRVRLTWVDERRVPFGDPESNRGQAYRLGYLEPGDPPAVELPLYLDGETAAEAWERVDGALSRDFGGDLDVLLLGLGEDGHSAALFPGRPWGTARVLLVDASPKPPSARITLSLAILTSAPVSVLAALGAGKAAALNRLLRGDPALPAAALSGLTVVTDIQDLVQGDDHG